MAAITAQMVKELRERTDLPMMECKQALTECTGDMQAAKDWLRKKYKGKQYYFGPLGNWPFALERFQREWPYIIVGGSPPPVDVGDGCTIRDLG